MTGSAQHWKSLQEGKLVPVSVVDASDVVDACASGEVCRSGESWRGGASTAEGHGGTRMGGWQVPHRWLSEDPEHCCLCWQLLSVVCHMFGRSAENMQGWNDMIGPKAAEHELYPSSGSGS